MRVRRSIMAIVVLSLAAGACSSSATPTPTTAPPTPTGSAPAESASAEPSMEASPSAEASAAASPAASLPASFPPATTFNYKGSKAGTSAAFDMYTPAQVTWTWSGKGPFTATIAPTGGVNNISTGTIANTTGKGSGSTWIYGDLTKSNYTITTTGTGDFNISVMSPVAPTTLPLPANLQGSSAMTTQPVQISGDVTITYQFRGSGDWDLSLIDATTGASVVDAAGGTGSVASSAVVHDLNGLYAFDVTTNSQWSVMVASLAQ